MFARRQTSHPTILSIVWYFTGGNQQAGAFNVILLLKELEHRVFTL